MEVAVAAIIAATGAAGGIAVLLCVYRLITLLGDPANAKMEAEIDEPEQLKDMSAKLDKRLPNSTSGRRLKGHGVRMIP